MATTFTLNYSGQEINNKLARVDDCLAKTAENVDYLQNANNFTIGNNQSQFVFDTSLGTTGTVLTLSTDSVERTYNGTTTHLDWTNIATKSNTLLIEPNSSTIYTQNSQGFTVSGENTVSGIPTVRAIVYTVNEPRFFVGLRDQSTQAETYGVSILPDEIFFRGQGESSYTHLKFSEIATKTGIKTINNISLIGSGNIQVAADVESITNAEIEALFNPPTLISFTIDGTTYQAESGMTWTAWCDSTYNTSGFQVSGGAIYTANSQYVVAKGVLFVTASDAILADTAYNYVTASSHSGGSSSNN